jgi:hypothetical protein
MEIIFLVLVSSVVDHPPVAAPKLDAPNPVATNQVLLLPLPVLLLRDCMATLYSGCGVGSPFKQLRK